MKIEATFVQERTTKNTVRYAEEVGSSDMAVGTLYVQKAAVSKLGNPQKIKVTIEKED